MKYAWIDTQRKDYGLTELCEALHVSASGYAAWKRGGSPHRQRLTDTQMVAHIRSIHKEVKGAYGSPRMTRELRARGYPASKERVERLMRENGIHARHKRRFKVTTDSKHSLPVAPNVLDLFNREIVGWSIKPRMTADIVTDALKMAWFRRRPAPGLIHHSDRGSQYASGAFQAQLHEYGMQCSMSRKGNCWDNACSESFFNSLKNERVHGARYDTQAEAKADIFDYIEPFYNRKRLHSTLGFASPANFLQHWINAQHEQQKAA